MDVDNSPLLRDEGIDVACDTTSPGDEGRKDREDTVLTVS